MRPTAFISGKLDKTFLVYLLTIILLGVNVS